MSDQDQHTNKRSTGTVPKQPIKYTRSVTEVDRLRSLSNSSSDYYHDSYNELRSPRRSNQIIDSSIPLQGGCPIPIGPINLNSVGSSNHSSTTSRKNSFGSTLKCDNITKHPNKKQIEDKLNQIHEYLKVTNSLMASIKKVDNQVLAQNEEFALESDFSSKKYEGNSNLENVGLNVINPKEHEPSSFLQRKSDNKCSSPRQSRNNLLLEVCNHMNTTSNNIIDRKSIHYGASCRQREDKKRMHPNPELIPTQDKSILKMDGLILQNHTMNMSNVNENSEQLFDATDPSDSELVNQHDELHKKIIELQNRKFQIDQFITQLQTSGAHGQDVEQQMMKICAMKTQLKKLKNMLEGIKTPINIENSNNPPDYEKTSCYLCSSSDNVDQKIKSRFHNESNIFRRTSNRSNEGSLKQLNKNSIEKSKMQSTKANVIKTALQTELESKKRELVEIMEKHKVNPSNLNQDLSLDTKSDFSFLTNGINDPWTSVISNDTDSDRFSSDEYQNDATEEIKHNFMTRSSPKFPSTVTNSQTENLQRSNLEFRPINRCSQTPETNYRSSSTCHMASHKNYSHLSNSQNLYTNQVQKQLEIIRSMCDSMLDQEVYSNIQNHNNQTHSSRRLSSPRQQNSSRNSDSGVNSEIQMQWFPPNGCNNANSHRQDSNNSICNSWLAANNVQTQSFVLNTLNQCYQMLLMQQKELTVLKNNVSMLQETLKNINFGSSVNISSTPLHANSQPSPNSHIRQPDLEHKINHDTYTIPITNQFDCPLSSIYFNPVNNSNNLIDSCLNNINLNHLSDQNSDHGMPNHLIPNHIWPGQALNNQVVPGNRANNYWDNFRSYSRQNLLSTKNSEVLQNLPTVVDRPNFINQCANPFAFMAFSKSNSEQGSTNTSQDNTIQRVPYKETNPSINLDTQPMINVNDRIKKNDQIESPSKDIFHKDNNSHFVLPSAPDFRRNHEDYTNVFPISEELLPEPPKLSDHENTIVTEECPCLKSNFEDMKENIYKEVASLISANENRPEFLIHLFRDLQLVKSDNVRQSILHSIERNIFNQHVTPSSANEQTYKPSSCHTLSNGSPDFQNLVTSSNNNDFNVCSNLLQETKIFLDRHEETVIHSNFFISLKEFLLNLKSLKEMFNNKACRIDIINVLNNDLQKYCGKRLGEIKQQLLQRIHYFIFEQRRIFAFVECGNTKTNDIESNIITSDVIANIKSANHTKEIGQTPTNGELAEADQTQSVNEEFSEEGAVGGILDASQAKPIDTPQILEPESVYLPCQLKPESTNHDSFQPVEGPELLGFQNNTPLDHQ